MQQNTAGTVLKGKAEFEAAARDLDEAHERLKETLEKLRHTMVEKDMRPEKEERSLLDFVDESGVEGLVGMIEGVINGAGEAIKESEDTNREFKKELREVGRVLTGEEEGLVAALEERSPLPDILNELEHYAKAMARELESLVTHYDLCVTAIKHTEGGGDVASKVASELPEGVDIGHDFAVPPEPIDEDQRREMVKVIEEDAGEIEGAVTDIRDHLTEMESLYERVEIHRDRLASTHVSTTAAFKLLEAIGHRLPNFITQSQGIQLRWESEKAKVDERLEELEGLTRFYDGFLTAYDNLLIEIGRRKTVEQKMEKEVQVVRARLEKLYEDDVEEREAFRNEQGDFLPVDIWPGLMAAPLRFEIAPVDYDAKVPDISKSVIHRAIRRVHGDR